MKKEMEFKDVNLLVSLKGLDVKEELTALWGASYTYVCGQVVIEISVGGDVVDIIIQNIKKK